MDAMDPDFSVTTDTTDSKVLDINNKQHKKQMRLELPNVAKMCVRYKVPASRSLCSSDCLRSIAGCGSYTQGGHLNGNR